MDQITLDGDIMRLSRDRAVEPEPTQTRRNAVALGRRLATIAEAINVCFSQQRDLDRRLARA
jgi:hypothetical protein